MLKAEMTDPELAALYCKSDKNSQRPQTLDSKNSSAAPILLTSKCRHLLDLLKILIEYFMAHGTPFPQGSWKLGW